MTRRELIAVLAGVAVGPRAANPIVEVLTSATTVDLTASTTVLVCIEVPLTRADFERFLAMRERLWNDGTGISRYVHPLA